MDRLKPSATILVILLGISLGFMHQVQAAGMKPPVDHSKPSLSGTVFVAAAGDPDTTPVAHALIVATRFNNAADPFGNPNRPIAITTTDEQGMWSLPQVPVGNLVVTATAPGFLRERSGRLHLGPGDHLDLVQRLVKAATEADDRPGTLTGQVVRLAKPFWGDNDDNDEDHCTSDTDHVDDMPTTPPVFVPIPGAWVTTYRFPDMHDRVNIDTLPVTGQTETDDDGRFTILSLHEGLHLVVAQALMNRPTAAIADIETSKTTEVMLLIVRSGDNPSTFPSVLVLKSDRPGDDCDAQWRFESPRVFDSPLPGNRYGWLILHTRNNRNTFGYMQSVDGWLHRLPESLYDMHFVLATDQDETTKTPGARLRANSDSLQQCDLLRISSLGDAGISPTPQGRPYDLFFEPMDIDMFLPRGRDRINVSFDILNFDPDDAAEGEVILKELKVNAFSLNRIETVRTLRAWTFDTGTEGWESRPDGPPFDNAQYSWSDGALVMKVPSPGNTFGYWTSPADGFTTPMAGQLIRAEFTIRSNQTDTSKAPGFRVRLNNADFELSAEKVIPSVDEGRNSPDTAGKIYPIYFKIPPAAAGKALFFSLDLTAFDPNDAANSELILDSVVVDEVALPVD